MPAVLNPIALAVTHRFERWCIAHSQTGPRQVEAKLLWRCDLSTRSDTGTLAYFTDSTTTFNVDLRCFLKNSFLKLTYDLFKENHKPTGSSEHCDTVTVKKSWDFKTSLCGLTARSAAERRMVLLLHLSAAGEHHGADITEIQRSARSYIKHHTTAH